MSVFGSLVVLAILGGCGTERLATVPSPSPVLAGVASAADLELVDSMVTWARTGEPAVLDPSMFAEEVALGLGQEIVAFRTFEELREPMSWRLDQDVFRAYVGPFSALDQLRRGGEVTVSIGQHPHCAAPPMDPPRGLANHRRLSIQPASAQSCLQWWTVDLFLGEDGRVEAITVDLYEP
jgi:hypothetical protein